MHRAGSQKRSQKRRRKPERSLAELVTLLVLFHQLCLRQFKSLYPNHACRYLRAEFPRLPSYQRVAELAPRCAALLAVLFECLKGDCDGPSSGQAQPPPQGLQGKRRAHGKTSMGWFYGFKLRAIINSKGELLRIKPTPGNTDDRKPVPGMCAGLFGLLFADKGYISKALAETLQGMGVKLVTALRKNMKPVPLTAFEKALLKRRPLIETVFDELKNLCQIEHTRHRSSNNFIVNLMAGIVAYCLSGNKPTLPLIRVNALAAA